jgi:PhzF family phenazine biosynthesis protein
MHIPYFHVDAFTSELFAGNPAGVCLLTDFPANDVMLKIAAENRHSETAFVVPRLDGGFDLRWFTPEVEDDLCGHATLATALVLADRGRTNWPVVFHTCSGELRVNRDGELYVLDFPARPPEPSAPLPGLLEALGVYAPEAVLKSIRDYLVVLAGSHDVQNLKPNIEAMRRLELGIGGAMVTAPGQGDVDYVVRFFPPSVGIVEDPATGSIHCTLAPYWADRLRKQRLHARQLSARGGEMWTELAGERVKIAGHARMYLRGTIDI